MFEVLAVAIGGALGAVARYGVVNAAYAAWGRDFPWGVLIANTLGSFLLGLLAVLFVAKFQIPVELRTAILVGVLGAFTTFSAFSLDTLYLFEQGTHLRALGNVLGN
ncbi:MAG: CrcB family protein, partial [Pseudomonadota bacterium]